MSMLPMGTPGPASPNLGALLASLAGGQQPMLPAPSMQPAQPQPSGSGGSVLMNALQPGLPAPVPRYQSASPGAGGIAPGPGVDARAASDLSFMGAESVAAQSPIMMMPSVPEVRAKPKFFGEDGPGRVLLGVVSDALSGFAGGPPRYAMAMQRQREIEDQRGYEEARWHREREAKREDDLRPRVEKVGDSVGYLDPANRRFDPIYTKPQPFEAYARQFGEPGTPDYQRAVNDYILRGWGESALGNKLGLDAYRFDRRGELQDERLDTQRDIATMRDTTTRRNTDVRVDATRDIATTRDGTMRRGQDLTDSRGRRGQDMTDRRTRDSASFNGRGGRGRGGAPATARIVNPQTKQVMVLRNGQWVPE